MASKSTLNTENLEALGAERLAALLIEVSTGDAAIKRRLRLELAGAESPAKLVNDIRKRLSAIEAGKTFIGWRTAKTVRTELRSIADLIALTLAATAPADALDLMWQLLGMADGILERTSDTGGDMLDIFRAAAAYVGPIATAAKPEAGDLALATGRAVLANGYGQGDGLIAALAPVLGASGLDQLRTLLTAAAKEASPRAALKARKVSKWRRGRKLERDVAIRRPLRDIVHRAFLEIADALGDVDAYIALHAGATDAESTVQFADRLLKAQRPHDALILLDEVKPRPGQVLPVEWYLSRATALDGLARPDDAQRTRLDGFHHTLGIALLKDYLKRLPDFDDIEAEDAAIDFARSLPDAGAVLEFLLRWPNLEQAAALVIGRQADIETKDESLLLLGADKLSARYPLAAALLLRKLINAILMQARSSDFARAADYLGDCARLDAHIDDYQGFDTHEAYVARLKASFRHRHDFWDAVS